VKQLHRFNRRVNLTIEDVEKWTLYNIEKYEEELDKLSQYLLETVKDMGSYAEGLHYEVNVLTDLLYLRKMSNCDAGTETITLAPNGKFYICPAFYFDNENSFVGTIETGIRVKNEYLLTLEHAPICRACDSYHCKRCKFLNKKLTNEYNTPSKIQCMISHIERNCTQKLQNAMKNEGCTFFKRHIPEIDYLDPLEKIKKEGVF
jgi:uncharacterized protein